MKISTQEKIQSYLLDIKALASGIAVRNGDDPLKDIDASKKADDIDDSADLIVRTAGKAIKLNDERFAEIVVALQAIADTWSDIEGYLDCLDIERHDDEEEIDDDDESEGASVARRRRALDTALNAAFKLLNK